MMKKYLNTFAKTFFFSSLPFIVLSFFIMRRTEIDMLYVRVTIGNILFSLFISLAITIFKSNKGNGVVNAVLGYILILPALIVFRRVFGEYLFSSVWVIYIIMVVVGIIYGVALLIASKKYKSEVDELNRLLLKKENPEELDDDEIE